MAGMDIDAQPFVEDDIDAVVAQTPSAARVVELVKRYGRKYANGELNHAERGRGITGSEIPTICGENRFEKPSAVLFKKVFDVRTPDTPAMAHGRATEPIAIARFQRQTGARVFCVGFMRHAKYDFIGGTFDALAILPTGEGVLVEVKCPYTRSIGAAIPPHYVGQVQTYLEVAGLARCMFVQYKPAFATPKKGLQRPERLAIASIQHDPMYFATRMRAMWDFWKRVCVFRAAVLPAAPAAATAIQCAWRFYQSGDIVRGVARKIALRRFRAARGACAGVAERVAADMERPDRRPTTEMPDDRPGPGGVDPHTTTLAIVLTPEDDIPRRSQATNLRPAVFVSGVRLVVCV
jgi:putative phage-type endonuclease